MNPSRDIALAILTRLEADGHLNKGAQFKDLTLLPVVIGLIDERLGAMREEFAHFCIWWAEIGHREQKHAPVDSNPFTLNDFWHCQHPFCLSLVGTIVDLARALKTTPEQLARPDAAPALP